jgi:hypothetical protein
MSERRALSPADQRVVEELVAEHIECRTGEASRVIARARTCSQVLSRFWKEGTVASRRDVQSGVSVRPALLGQVAVKTAAWSQEGISEWNSTRRRSR